MNLLILVMIAVGCWPQTHATSAMKRVRVIQARVQGDKPQYNDTLKTFVSSFGDGGFTAKYRAGFDSINTASVEGALMYVQAEGINVKQNADCKRKNDMKYIVFYQVDVLQPDSSLQAYDAIPENIPEYAPYYAIDSGMCTPEGNNQAPKACQDIYDNKVLPAVGAGIRDSDPRAPYPDTIWYSFPNSCLMKKWTEKTSECRKSNPGGLCAYGEQPDGDTCSFTYRTLGFLSIDDLVGITSLKHSQSGAKYANYTEFCQDKQGEFKGVEYSAMDTPPDPKSVTSLPFWKDPFDAKACQKRTEQMVKLYNQHTEQDPRMTALPSVQQLTQFNPSCAANSKRCASSPFGCKRVLFSQICRVCDRQEDGCSAS